MAAVRIRLTYTTARGTTASRPIEGEIIPPVGAICGGYPERPGTREEVPAEWKLRVVGVPEFRYIGRTIEILVPCELIDSTNG